MKRGASGWPLLIVLGFLAICGGKIIAEADDMTVSIKNSAGMEIIPRKVGSSSTGSMDYPPVPPNDMMPIKVERGDSFALFFAHNCSRDNSGHLKNCSSGDCPEGSCTRTSKPLATSVQFENGAVSLSVLNGYNFPLKIVFDCGGCGCPSISCAIPLTECPEELKKYDESGLPVACMAGTGLPSCQDNTAPSSTTCSFENVIMHITVGKRK